MDLLSLAAVLQAALSPNPAERKAAEKHLNRYRYHPEYMACFLQIIVDRNYDLPLRQIASIHFKKFIAENWSHHDPEKQSMISPSDKDFFRQNILVSIEQVPTLLRAQLGECLKPIIEADYPENWPGLLQWVTLKLQGQQVSGALFVLHILCRKYKFKSGEERTPIHHVIEETFPHFFSAFTRLVHIKNPSTEVGDSIKLICKIFYFSMFQESPKALFDPYVFNAWMHLFIRILKRPVLLKDQPADKDLRKSWIWWKVKKWTLKVLKLVCTRHEELKLDESQNKRVLEWVMDMLNAIRVGAYFPDKVTYLILQYLNNSSSKSVMYNLPQEKVDVLFETIFQLMCFNDNDQKLWDQDPHKYVRNGYDYSPKIAAMYFVSEVVGKGGKENLQKFLSFIMEILKRYEEAPIEIKPYRQKDGALLAIGTLCDELKQTEPYKSELEDMILQHVFPEFRSPVGHIRAKAAWVAGKYAHINFSDRKNFCNALIRIIAGMRDPELPVHVDSVFALYSFVDATIDPDEITPVLPQLLDELLKVVNEVEHEDLLVTLLTIVHMFEDDLAPYAVSLCQNLAPAVLKYLKSAETDADCNAISYFCLSAINSILDSVRGRAHLFAHFEPILLPILRWMLTTNIENNMHEVFEMVSHLTFCSPTISMDMWSLWPLLMKALNNEWGIYYLGIRPVFEDYISRSTIHYLTCKEPDYQQSLWIMLSNAMGDKNLEDENMEFAPKIISAVLQKCRGKVDNWVGPYIMITVKRLCRAKSQYFKCLLMQVIADALYYNASLTYNILQKLGVSTLIFKIWFQMLPQIGNNDIHANFTSKGDKRVCCLGLTSVLSLPAHELPEEVLEDVFKATLDMLVAYKDQVAEEKKQSKYCYGMSDDLQTDDDDDVDDDDTSDDVDDLQTDDDDDDFSDDDSSEDEDLHSSSTDEVDPFVLFDDTFAFLQRCDPMRSHKLLMKLDLTYLKTCEQLLRVIRKKVGNS